MCPQWIGAAAVLVLGDLCEAVLRSRRAHRLGAVDYPEVLDRSEPPGGVRWVSQHDWVFVRLRLLEMQVFFQNFRPE
jgi:hypothetical protein